MLNHIVIMGRLTRDPELRTTQSGTTLCSFGLAVNRRRKAEGQAEVDFFNITAWRQLGEICAKYLHKGRKCCVVGQIQIRTYDAQDGTKRTAVDIVAEDIEFLSAARDADGNAGNAGSAAAPALTPSGEYDTSGFSRVDADELPF